MRMVTPNQQADLFRAAFDQVCDPKDWKGPIDCKVPYDLANLYMQAIEFMTGVKPEVGERTCEIYGDSAAYLIRLTCVGYRAGPCGG